MACKFFGRSLPVMRLLFNDCPRYFDAAFALGRTFPGLFGCESEDVPSSISFRIQYNLRNYCSSLVKKFNCMACKFFGRSLPVMRLLFNDCPRILMRHLHSVERFLVSLDLNWRMCQAQYFFGFSDWFCIVFSSLVYDIRWKLRASMLPRNQAS